jgi:hypothetical protein
MMYASPNLRPPIDGQTCKLIQFDVLPDRIHQLNDLKVGQPRTQGCDSHVSPNGFEYVMFDSRHILPRYVLTINVVKAVGPAFVGSVENIGSSKVQDPGEDNE